MTHSRGPTQLTVRGRVLVAATITILLSGVAGYQVYRESQRSVVLVASYTSTLSAASTARTLTFVAQNIDRLLREALRTQERAVTGTDPETCRQRLEELARLGPLGGMVTNLYLVRSSEVVCQMLPGPISTRGPDGALFRELRPVSNLRELRSSQPFIGSLSKRWIISVVLPRPSTDALTAGAAIDLEKLNDYALGNYPDQLLITVTDADSTTLLRSKDFASRVGNKIPFLPAVTDVNQQVQGFPVDVDPQGQPRVVQPNAVVSPDRDGSLRVWSSREVETIPWVLFAGVSTAIVSAPLTVVGLGPATSLVLVVLVLLLLATVSRSLTRLMRGVELSAVEGPAAIPVDGPRDIALLGQALQGAIAARLQSEAALERANRGLEEKVDERSRELAAKAADLEQVVHKLIEADRVKDVFLGTMSHELRTPITSILGLVESLLTGSGGELTAEQRHALEVCAQCAKDQTELIREVLDYTKLRSGSMPYDFAPMTVGDLIESARMRVAPQAAAKRLTIWLDLASVDRTVWVDARRMRQVLLNLLGNAIKFSPDGTTITISTRVGSGRFWIEVRDQGPGVAADMRERIFEPFVQADSGLRRSFEGLGLGLAICRSIVTAHHGTIHVEDNAGGGARFIVELSALPPAAA